MSTLSFEGAVASQPDAPGSAGRRPVRDFQPGDRQPAHSAVQGYSWELGDPGGNQRHWTIHSTNFSRFLTAALT